MKIQPNSRLSLFAALMGAVGMLLRFCVYALATDAKGLLITGHPLILAVWLVTAAACAAAVLYARAVIPGGSYEENFPASSAAAAGCFVMAVCVGVTVLRSGIGTDRVEVLCFFSGILAAASLIFLGLFRLKGRQPGFGFPAMVCLYVSAYTIACYPSWTSSPQLMDSLFSLLGGVGLMVVSYQQTAFCVGLGSRRMTVAAGLLTAYFCMTAVAGNGDFLLYLGGALWALTNLCAPALSPEA